MKLLHPLALFGLSILIASPAVAQRKLDDGTWVVSPMVVAAEMIVDETKAKRKYAGRALQMQARCPRSS